MSDDQIDPVEAENLLLGLYLDEVEHEQWDYFEHCGLPADCSWGQFRRHYDLDGVPDSDRAFQDLTNYPPVKAYIEELRARGESVVVDFQLMKKLLKPDNDPSDAE